MIYGYKSKVIDEKYELLEMKEVTFAAQPSVLREIGGFFLYMTDNMENDQAVSCSHRHIDSFVDDWHRRFPGKDIVISYPAEQATL
jgi:hypothetical protein